MDLFTNVSQIYGICFFPRDLVTSHFINLYLTMVFQYLESTLLTLVVATSDKPRSSFQDVKMVYIKLVNMSIAFVFQGFLTISEYSIFCFAKLIVFL